MNPVRDKMKKYFPHISGFILTLVLVFMVSGLVFPQTARAQNSPLDYLPIIGSYRAMQAGLAAGAVKSIEPAVVWVVTKILQTVSLLTGLGAVILNGVIYYTIVKITDNYSSLTSINTAWSAVRDLANMGFIFILLYAAIQTILGMGEDVRKLIVRVIVVAILINFSLFFTKIIIDISNILALLFYDAIAPGAAQAGFTGSGSKGLADAFMQLLDLQSLYATADSSISMGGIITVGILGSIMLLIAAFVFFAVAIMFLIRYVILILVLILSPIAFMAFVLPALKKHGDQWWNALSGQAFFAPIYFMLTWVTFQVLSGVMQATTKTLGASATGATASSTIGSLAMSASGVVSGEVGAFSMIINFIIIIIFLIISLIIAKDWANKAGGAVSGLNKWAMGAAGGATIGMAGGLGRNIIGSRAATMANDEDLKKRAAEGGRFARLQLAAANKMAGSSFDIRGSRLGGSLDAGKAQKGGFIQDQKDRAKKYEKYKPSKDAIDEAKKAETESRKTLDQAAERAIPKSDEHRLAEIELQTLRRTPTRGLSDQAVLARSARIQAAQETVERHQEDLNTARKSYAQTSPVLNVERVLHDRNEAIRKTMEGRMEDMEKRMKNNRFAVINPVGGLFVSGKSKAQAIRAAAKGKSNKEKLAEAAAALAKEEAEASGEAEPTTPPATPPSPPPTT